MHIELITDGGFAAIPGLAKPILLDATKLSPPLRGNLEDLVNSALSENASNTSLGHSPVPDARHYRIIIKRNGVQDIIETSDPITSRSIQALIEFIQSNGVR
jgi:hypothetical protein